MILNILDYIRNEYGKNPFSWIYLLIGFVAIVTVSSMGYIFLIGNRTIAGYAPLMHTTMEIELEATRAHLWLEEIISGDRKETLEDALIHINRVDQYAKSIVEGGVIEGHLFSPLKDQHLRQEINAMQNRLNQLKGITIRRWNAYNKLEAGVEIDREYDAVFESFISQANHLEATIEDKIEHGLKSFRTVQLVLIALCLSVTAIVGTTFSRFVRRRIRDERRLRDLVSELTIAEDRERRSIAALLHDEVMQKLAMSKMKIGELRETMTTDSQIEHLENIARQINSILGDMRSLTFDLCPPILYDIGLESALRDWLYREISDGQELSVNFETIGEPLRLSEDLRVAMYRAAREALINVIKHAQARTLSVKIENLSDKLRIVITDDGVGFKAAVTGENKKSGGGLGLFTIRERLEHFGGSLKIESVSGRGTRVTLTAPLTCEKSSRETA